MSNDLCPLSFISAPEVQDILADCPVELREEIETRLTVFARSLIAQGADRAELQVRTTENARTLVNDAKVTSLQTAWNITSPRPARAITEEVKPHDLFKGLEVMAYVSRELKDQYAVKRIWSRLRRESADWPDEGFDEALKSRADELIKEAKRLDYTPTESWFYGRKAKGQLPDRAEFLKRVPPASNPLPLVKYDKGFAHFDLSVLNPECRACLAVRLDDEPVVRRLSIDNLILKPSRGKGTKWKLSFKWRWFGRSTRMVSEVALETLITSYSIIDGQSETGFTATELEEAARRQHTRIEKDALSFDETWMAGASSTGWHSAPAPSAVGMASAGDKRQALGKWRSGREAGSNGGNDFAESVSSVGHERNDVSKRSGQEFKTQVNLRRRLGEED